MLFYLEYHQRDQRLFLPAFSQPATVATRGTADVAEFPAPILSLPLTTTDIFGESFADVGAGDAARTASSSSSVVVRVSFVSSVTKFRRLSTT